jgi:AraC-like DNA-binding protein
VGLTYKKFASLRGGALSEAENEQNIIRSIEILHHLLERYVLEETKIPEMLDERRRKMNEYVNKATEYISKNFLTLINSQDVAEHCHISESHLKHLFSVAVGHGIAEEIRDLRLNYAKELLCTTEYSVKYISFATCFGSSDYFSTVFKKKFKMSPLEYRRYGKIKK